MKTEDVWPLVKESFVQFGNDKAARMGASLAYYTVFAIGPLLVVVIAISGWVLGPEAASGEVTGALKSALGANGAQTVQAMLKEAGKPGSGSWAAALGAAGLIVAAIGIVGQLRDALNTIWKVEPSKGSGVWGLVGTYVVSLAGVLALALLLLVSMMAHTFTGALASTVAPALGEWAVNGINFAVSFAVLALMIAMTFKWLPEIDIAWGVVWAGALVTAALFTIGQFVIGLYLGSGESQSMFGAAASLVVLLVWVYYSAQILLLGAEFTQVYAKRKSSHAGHPHAQVPVSPKPPQRSALPGIISIVMATMAMLWFEHRRRAHVTV